MKKGQIKISETRPECELVLYEGARERGGGREDAGTWVQAARWRYTAPSRSAQFRRVMKHVTRKGSLTIDKPRYSATPNPHQNPSHAIAIFLNTQKHLAAVYVCVRLCVCMLVCGVCLSVRDWMCGCVYKCV